MAHGLYEPEECESERTVIISELQGGENDPDQLLDTEVTATAFRAHPYRHPTIGWIDDLRSMTRDDLYRYYRRHYVPDNATLVVVGDVDRRGSPAARRSPFRANPRRLSASPTARRSSRTRSANAASLLEREGTTAYVKFAWHAPAATETDFFPDAGARCGTDRRERGSTSGPASAARRRSARRGFIPRSSSAGWRLPSRDR